MRSTSPTSLSRLPRLIQLLTIVGIGGFGASPRSLYGQTVPLRVLLDIGRGARQSMRHPAFRVIRLFLDFAQLRRILDARVEDEVRRLDERLGQVDGVGDDVND